LLAANIYSKGHLAGLLLPFLLGVGMALPWPFAGAGLAFLPKPGKWMNRVKHGFGALILLFALYYVHLALGAYTNKRAATSLASAPGSGVAPSVADTSSGEFAEALRQARLQGRPVLVDFHASWCKNCLAMDETVFKKSEVKKRVQDFIVVRYDAERPGQSPAREVLDHFGVMGLPTYVVLTCTK
jgi:thiol:disulfide interchange protein DsbD